MFKLVQDKMAALGRQHWDFVVISAASWSKKLLEGPNFKNSPQVCNKKLYLLYNHFSCILEVSDDEANYIL